LISLNASMGGAKDAM